MAPIMENGGVYNVAVIGSGNWGSVATKIIASNTIKQSIFHGNFFYFLFFQKKKLPSVYYQLIVMPIYCCWVPHSYFHVIKRGGVGRLWH
jgi:hypothetical protein